MTKRNTSKKASKPPKSQSKWGKSSWQDEENWDHTLRTFNPKRHENNSQQRKNYSSKKSDIKSTLNQSNFELAEENWAEKIEKSGAFPARIVEVHKRYCFVSPLKDGTIKDSSSQDLDTKDVWLATIAKRHLQSIRRERNFITVGDWVLCQPSSDMDAPPIDTKRASKHPIKDDEPKQRNNESEHEDDELEQDIDDNLPQCTVEHMAPRTNKISREDPIRKNREHTLAANVDLLLIVASYFEPSVKWRLIDRYLILAEEQNIRPIIILNKKDLLDKASTTEQQNCQHYTDIYSKLGYKIYSVQANEETDNQEPYWQEIEQLFQDRTVLLSGHSGVGKSSVVNRFRPEIEQDVEQGSIFYKGRHTTTYASLIKLGTGGYVIDSPGIRSFILEPRTSLELSWCFKEFRQFLGQCKYRECAHRSEPGCRIKQELEDPQGSVTKERYLSYCMILDGESTREGRQGTAET